MMLFRALSVAAMAAVLSPFVVPTSAWLASDSATCLGSSNYPGVNALINSRTASWNANVTSSINIIVYFVAWNDTPEAQKFRIPYSNSRTPNYFPSGLQSGTYGPKLPDYRVNPIQRASRFFQQMTFGKVGFNGTYRSVQLDENLPASCLSCPYSDITERVMRKVNSSLSAAYRYYNYDVSLFVFPEETAGSSGCSPQKYYQVGHRAITYGGYALFRHNDNIMADSDAYSLYQSIAGLFGLTDSDYWDYKKIKHYTRDDRTDIMGKSGIETMAFTNPYNLYRMGVLDMTTDIRPITRTGVYRVWPLYLESFDKGYAYDGSLDTTAAQTYKTPEVWQRYRGILFNPDITVSGNTVSNSQYYSIIWQRNEVTYKIAEENSNLRAIYNFSHSLILHQHTDTSSVTAFTQKDTIVNTNDDSITNSSRLVPGQSLDSFFSYCKSEVLCRDTTTSPVSFLLSVECILASDTVITGFNLEGASNYLEDGAITYVLSYQNSSILNSNTTFGYVSLAVTGTSCSGAAALKFSPSQIVFASGTMQVYIEDSQLSWYKAFTSGQSISVCYAEFDSGGVNDEFFVEQSLVSVQKQQSIYTPLSKCQDTTINSCTPLSGTNASLTDAADSSSSSAYFACYGTTSIVSTSTCCCKNVANATASCTLGAIVQTGRKSCCNNRGFASIFNVGKTGTASATYGVICSCDESSSYTGRYCHNIIGSALKLSVAENVTFYSKAPFTLSATLGALPQTADYTATCFAVFQNGSNQTVGTLTYAQSSGNGATASTSLTKSLTITPTDDYVPSVNFTCVSTSPSSEYYSNARFVLNVSVTNRKAVSSPQRLRALSYGENGTMSFGWDSMDGYASYSDLYYTLNYRTYSSSSQGSWVSVNTSLTSQTLSNLIVAQVYQVTVTSTSPSAGPGRTSDYLYVIPINYNSTCASVGGDSNPKVCSSSNCNSTFGSCATSGDCWCKGWYHGSDCSISGCYYTADDQASGIACSGHGTCQSYGNASDKCVCDTGYYGIWCRKLDWYNGAINFTNPIDTATTIITHGSSFTVQWNMPSGSLSNGGTLYIQYVAPNLGTDAVNYDGWTKLADITYPTTGAASYSYVVSSIDSKGLVPVGYTGIVAFQVRDWYYNNLAQTAYASLNNPTPTAAPTTPAPTAAPTAAPTKSESGTSTGLLSGSSQIYAAVGISVVVLATAVGTTIFCAGRIRRKMYGQHQLQDVGVTGTTDEKATEVAEIH
jgi:hypothetical protein